MARMSTGFDCSPASALLNGPSRAKCYFFAFLNAPLNALSVSPRATIASFYTSGKQSSA